MNTLLILAGVYLSSKIVKFLAEELTETELERQQEIQSQLEKYREKPQAFDVSTELDADQTLFGKKLNEEKRKYLLSEASERKTERESFKKELIKTRKETLACLGGEKYAVHTPLRKSSLELLLRQLSKAIEQCDAYIQYLAVYQKGLSQITGFSSDGDDFPVFSMMLPSDYPYVGKIIWVDTNQIQENRVVLGAGIFETTVYFTDIERSNDTACTTLPAMITHAEKNSAVFHASFENGDFIVNGLANTHLGFDATVTEIRKKSIILTYKDCLKLLLPRDYLIDPYRFPPVRSVLTVYPVNWKYDLQLWKTKDGIERFPVTVSEKMSDASSSFQFRTVPICFTKEDYNSFLEYYNSSNLELYKDQEFLIGLDGDTWTGLHKGVKLKLQLGDFPLLVVKIDEATNDSDCYRYFLRFDHLCTKEDSPFSANDVFVPFDVSITPYIAGTTDEILEQYAKIDDLNDVSTYIWDIAEELRLQDQIRKNRKGIGYFFRWESVTGQLVSALEKGEFIQLEVKWLSTNEEYSIYAEIENTEDLRAFLQGHSQTLEIESRSIWKPQFFVEDDKGVRFSAYLTNDSRIEIVGGNVAFAFEKHPKHIKIFIRNAPYAEYQQMTALRQFRRGQVVNAKIQAACLDSSSITPEQIDGVEIKPFYNPRIQRNASQKQIVERAAKEKNIFFIQGPPGTGKTTVIRELVEQLYISEPSSRILIVSQANVAVDNALNGFVKRYNEEIVRCGNIDKVADEHRELHLDNRCEEYLNELKLRKDNFAEEFYESWEKKVLPDKNGNYLPALYELVIRNHRIVGATCVGLARKKIGLDRTSFDLVIIDEAGKALPAEMLIPLLRAKKAIIIGDQNQLPPVINPLLYDEEKIELEDRAISENELFEHSFFERLFENAPDACKGMLDTQYRMPAVIGSIISNLFYDGELKNGSGTESRQPVLFSTNLSFVDYGKCDDYTEEKDADNSVINRKEAFEAFKLVNRIKQKEPECKVAVITPYRGQKRLIRDAFEQCKIDISDRKIEIDTIDAFQGSEADIVVFCTTRARKRTVFFQDSKRINVALSRARRELIILGNLQYFYKYDRDKSCLPALADYISKRGNIVRAN